MSSLNFYEFQEELPDKQSMRKEIDRLVPLEFLITLMDRGLTFSQSKDPFDLLTFYGSEGQKGLDPEVQTNKVFIENVGMDLKEFAEKGLFEAFLNS